MLSLPPPGPLPAAPLSWALGRWLLQERLIPSMLLCSPRQLDSELQFGQASGQR